MSADAVPDAPRERWSIADMDALKTAPGVRYELVDGVPRMLPPPRGRHQHVARRLANALETFTPTAYAIFDGVGVELAPTSGRSRMWSSSAIPSRTRSCTTSPRSW